MAKEKPQQARNGVIRTRPNRGAKKERETKLVATEQVEFLLKHHSKQAVCPKLSFSCPGQTTLLTPIMVFVDYSKCILLPSLLTDSFQKKQLYLNRLSRSSLMRSST